MSIIGQYVAYVLIDELEIPEIIDGVIEIRAISREPGYRSKVAVISSDGRVDCVGACVGDQNAEWRDRVREGAVTGPEVERTRESAQPCRNPPPCTDFATPCDSLQPPAAGGRKW